MWFCRRPPQSAAPMVGLPERTPSTTMRAGSARMSSEPATTRRSMNAHRAAKAIRPHGLGKISACPVQGAIMPGIVGGR